MPDAKKKPSPKPQAKAKGTQMDVLFAGPLLFVPSAAKGKITGVEVFSPNNGHPIGALFLPEVWFSDAELDDPKCERWPEPGSFSLLDPHSYTIDIAQRGDGESTYPVASIPAANHRVRAGRRLGTNWEVAIEVNGHLSNWTSHRFITVGQGMFGGSDQPLPDTTVASLQRLSYKGSTGVEFCGIAPEPSEYLRSNGAKGGTLIVIGEIPYQPSLLHERQAVDAIARLAGLDMHLLSATPTTGAGRLMNHVVYCLASVIVSPKA